MTGNRLRCSPVCGDMDWSQVSLVSPEPAPACCSLWGKSPFVADREMRDAKEIPCWTVRHVPGIVQSTSRPLLRTTERCCCFKILHEETEAQKP